MSKTSPNSEMVAEALLILKAEIKDNHCEEGHAHIRSFFDALKESYPITARRTMVSKHYANRFFDEHVKEIAFILDELNVFLFKHGAIGRDTAATYFNGLFAGKQGDGSFTRSEHYPKEVVLMDIDSLLYALTA